MDPVHIQLISPCGPLNKTASHRGREPTGQPGNPHSTWKMDSKMETVVVWNSYCMERLNNLANSLFVRNSNKVDVNDVGHRRLCRLTKVDNYKLALHHLDLGWQPADGIVILHTMAHLTKHARPQSTSYWLVDRSLAAAGCSGPVAACQTVAWRDPGSNLIMESCVYHDSHCDMQPWAWAAHPSCSA